MRYETEVVLSKESEGADDIYAAFYDEHPHLKDKVTITWSGLIDCDLRPRHVSFFYHVVFESEDETLEDEDACIFRRGL